MSNISLGISQSRGYENTNLINIENKDGVAVVSSRVVANDFGKQHKHVLEAIHNLKKELSTAENSALFIEAQYKASNGKMNKEYLLTRDGFSLLVMGFTGKEALQWKLKYIEAFNKMEEMIKNPYANLSKELQFMIQLEQNQNQLDQRLVKLENNMTIDYGQQLEIQNAVSRAAIKALGGYDSYAYRNKSVNRKTFNAIYKMLKNTFQVNSYKNISTKNFNAAKELIATWKPNDDLILMIRGANAQMLLGDVI